MKLKEINKAEFEVYNLYTMDLDTNANDILKTAERYHGKVYKLKQKKEEFKLINFSFLYNIFIYFYNTYYS